MDSDTWFCGHVCMAARKMHIALRRTQNGLAWFDFMADRAIEVPSAGDEKSTLKAACEALVNYLNPPCQTQSQ